jgi:protein-L-isoaspartate(D-aspartate) O-methyltransferase
MKKERFIEKRERMVRDQIETRGIKSPKVLDAMRAVPRHLFVSENMQLHAYSDEPLQIGEGQTISQPYIVAYMTEILNLEDNMKVLEVGTGSGYQSAVLAEIVKEVYSVEIIPSLSSRSQNLLKNLGYQNIFFRVGDGREGWKDHSPYDGIIVTAAPKEIPVALQDQLKVGGRMILPVGEASQELVLIKREEKGFAKEELLSVRFVPLVSLH